MWLGTLVVAPIFFSAYIIQNNNFMVKYCDNKVLDDGMDWMQLISGMDIEN